MCDIACLYCVHVVSHCRTSCAIMCTLRQQAGECNLISVLRARLSVLPFGMAITSLSLVDACSTFPRARGAFRRATGR